MRARGRRRLGLVLAAVWCGIAVTGCERADSTEERGARGDALVARRLPRVVYLGGPFLRHPRIVTITFAGDDRRLAWRLARFGDTVTRSRWWRLATRDYCTDGEGCIGAGRRGRHVRLHQSPPAKIGDIQVGRLLARAAAAGHLGPLDPETLLLVYLPKQTRLADAFVPRYCGDGPRALHRALRLERVTLAYAVMPRCGGEATLTASASHEIVEATTNPDPAMPGFAFAQESANLGFTASGVEPVDPCSALDPDRHVRLGEGFAVQRAWSNRAASLGHDPCVPAPSARPYVALVPRQATVRLTRRGEQAIITLDARADRHVGAWSVSALDLTGRRERKRHVDASLDRPTVAAGTTARLVVTMRKRHPRGVSVVGIVSTLRGHSHMWPLAIVSD
jgi:hypothetical protein